MNVSEIPDIFIKAGYIPAQLLFKKNDYPTTIKVKGFIWELNADASVPFYEHRGAELNKPIDKQQHKVYTFITRRNKYDY